MPTIRPRIQLFIKRYRFVQRNATQTLVNNNQGLGTSTLLLIILYTTDIARGDNKTKIPFPKLMRPNMHETRENIRHEIRLNQSTRTQIIGSNPSNIKKLLGVTKRVRIRYRIMGGQQVRTLSIRNTYRRTRVRYNNEEQK